MAKKTWTVNRNRHIRLVLLGFGILFTLLIVNFQSLPGKAASLATYDPSLLFGNNLLLSSTSDTFLTSSAQRTGLQNIHTQIIRIPSRPNSTVSNNNDEVLVKSAAQYVHDLGMTPLVILGGPARSNPLGDDTPIVNDMNSIFGSSVVYYEYGNESDLNGISQSTYTSSWNTVIPQLKALAQNGKFIGPVNYQYDDAYLRYFLQNANPRPDAVSWHMYTCNTTTNQYGQAQTESTCLANIGKWPQYFTEARTAMHDIFGGTTEVPILITEWNYDPHTPAYNNDSTFITNWVDQALDTLANGNVFASMYYDVNQSLPLVNSDGTITSAGQAFQSEYAKLVGSGTATPTPTAIATSTPTSTPTVTATPTPGNTVIAQDTFQRSNQTYWGTASDGQTWGGDANSATNFSISNNTGQVATGTGTVYNATLGSTASNAEVLFSGSMTSFTNSNLGAALRWTDTNNWYKAYIDGSNLVIQKKVSGTSTTLATVSFAASTGTSYTIRFRVVGTTLSAKVWASSSSEPSNWTATASDSSLSSGYCGLRIQVLHGAVATVTSFQATQAS